MKRRLIVLLVLALASATPALAQAPVAEGLNGPMGVLIAPDGALWIIDSGVGGDQTFEIPSPETGEMMTMTFGMTARVIRVAADGGQEVMAQLPSLNTGFDVAGGARLTLLGGEVYATSGGWVGAPDGGAPPPLMAQVVRLVGGEAVPVADAWSYEAANNPDGFILEAHPYGLASGPSGLLWVADAGANTVYTVDPTSGAITLVAVLEGLPGPFPNPAREGAMEMDPVPTGVVVAADGSVYVSLLPGGPFPPGSSKVVKVAADGSISDYALGLTMTTDLRAGPDGNLYAVQFGEFSEQGPVPGSGAVVRFTEGGATETVLEGLVFPTSIDFDPDGNAFVAVGGVGPPGSGQVLRFDGLAAER